MGIALGHKNRWHATTENFFSYLLFNTLIVEMLLLFAYKMVHYFCAFRWEVIENTEVK